MTTWFGWFLIGAWWLNALLTINFVGYARKPLTSGLATVSVITAFICTVLLLKVGA